MQIVDLIQGTPEWRAHRAQHFNASDAPAMMGCSPYKTRDQLIRELATGLKGDVSAEKEAIFADGHRFEALARPLAEEIIGEDLYPVTGTEGKFSASFDGLTLMYEQGFEHKTLNAELRALEVFDGRTLPLYFRVQMEHQILVSSAERILFMASKWKREQAGNWVLEEERHCWYYPDPELRAQIIAGWEVLEQDVAAYVPHEAEAKPIGRTIENLPALRIEVTGAVMASNLDEYREHALAVFCGINRDLQTDQDFADAEKAVKWCSDVEGRLAAVKDHTLSQTQTIDAVFKAIDQISAEARRTRLELEKLVKARKDQIREDIVRKGQAALAEHLAALNERLGRPYMPSVLADFAGAIKGKRTLESLRDAVNTTLAKAKAEANTIADRIAANLATLREFASDYAFLFADTPTIVLKAPDDLTMLVKARIAEQKDAEAKRLEEQRERIRKEEADRLERERIAQEAIDNAKANAQPAPQVAPLPPDEPPAHAPTPAPTAPATPAAPASQGETITMSQLNELIAPLMLTTAGMRELGIEPARKERAASLYFKADVPRVCDALIKRLQGVKEFA